MAEQSEIDEMLNSSLDLESKAEESETSTQEFQSEGVKRSDELETGSSNAKADPKKGVPWIDFYPENAHKPPEDLLARLREHQDNIRQMLLVKELFKLRTLEIKIHRSYYWNWVREANKILVNTVRLRSRLRELEKNKRNSIKIMFQGF